MEKKDQNGLMHKIKLQLRKRTPQRIIILVIALLITLSVITPFYFFLDSLTYDLFLKYAKKPISQDDSLLLVDIDDYAMNELPYSWPWPRFMHGDAVEVLSDFEAKAVIFDVEFLGASVPYVMTEEVKELKSQLFVEAQKIYSDFVQRVPESKFNEDFSKFYLNIDSSIHALVRDNDQYFSRRLKYFGRAFGTVNMLYDQEVSEKDQDTDEVQNNLMKLMRFGIPIDAVKIKNKNHQAIHQTNVAEFPVDKILDSYKGVGFTKVRRDKDAAIRSIDLLYNKDGFLVPQLALRPFLYFYNIQPEQIDLTSPFFLKFRDVKLNGRTTDISIPLCKGRMQINWPNGEFPEIFVNRSVPIDGKYYHFSYANLIIYKNKLLPEFYRALKKFEDTDDNYLKGVLGDYEQVMDIKNEAIESGEYDDTLKQNFRNFFFNVYNDVYLYCSEENINKIKTQFKSIVDSGVLKQNDIMEYQKLIDQKITLLTELGDISKIILQYHDDLSKTLKGKICFVGLTATGTTDIGSTPFDRDFENVGTHPAIFNTILQNDFIRIIPSWAAFIFAIIIFSVGIWFVIKREAVFTAMIGLIFTLILVVLIALFFRMTNIYFSPVYPLFYGLFSFFSLVVLKFILAEKDKSFIKNAFNKYLSPEVIKEILKDPSKLVLGGERRFCTAIFTDIEGFSSISEKFMDDPKGLVKLLNEYLSRMSDIILDNKGTIDKYEGDAIIGFFGAPHYFDDHPLKACAAALKMKAIETELNEKFLKDKIIDKPLLTRVGLNTGEMFVGNMGTDSKFNYTMMGHAVNLAARLEGVNKLYGTYLMLSEFTYQYIKNDVVCRKLDRVRVVNINTPIRLYEPVALKNDVPREMLEHLELFHKALEAFEKRDWKTAKDYFEKAKMNAVWDKAVNIYIERCIKYQKTPPAANWDGVYNMTVK